MSDIIVDDLIRVNQIIGEEITGLNNSIQNRIYSLIHSAGSYHRLKGGDTINMNSQTHALHLLLDRETNNEEIQEKRYKREFKVNEFNRNVDLIVKKITELGIRKQDLVDTAQEYKIMLKEAERNYAGNPGWSLIEHGISRIFNEEEKLEFNKYRYLIDPKENIIFSDGINKKILFKTHDTCSENLYALYKPEGLYPHMLTTALFSTAGLGLTSILNAGADKSGAGIIIALLCAGVKTGVDFLVNNCFEIYPFLNMPYTPKGA